MLILSLDFQSESKNCSLYTGELEGRILCILVWSGQLKLDAKGQTNNVSSTHNNCFHGPTNHGPQK